MRLPHEVTLHSYKSEFPFQMNNLCHAWSHFDEHIVREEHDVNKLKMSDRQTTDETFWSLARCDEIAR